MGGASETSCRTAPVFHCECSRSSQWRTRYCHGSRVTHTRTHAPIFQRFQPWTAVSAGSGLPSPPVSRGSRCSHTRLVMPRSIHHNAQNHRPRASPDGPIQILTSQTQPVSLQLASILTRHPPHLMLYPASSVTKGSQTGTQTMTPRRFMLQSVQNVLGQSSFASKTRMQTASTFCCII